MHWSKQQETYALNRPSVIRNAPEASGIYGLFTPGRWIYIGASWNIHAALLEYLHGRKQSVLQWEPTCFTFEVCPTKERRRRQRELVEHISRRVIEKRTPARSRCRLCCGPTGCIEGAVWNRSHLTVAAENTR